MVDRFHREIVGEVYDGDWEAEEGAIGKADLSKGTVLEILRRASRRRDELIGLL